MKRFFLIPLMTMFCVVMAWGNVAKIGNTEYATVKDAIAAVPDGVETQIDLIDDVSEAFITIGATKNVVLNLAGHSLVSNVNEDNNQWYYEYASILIDGGTLRIIAQGTEIVGAPVETSEYGFPVMNKGGHVTIDGGIYIGKLVDWGYGFAMANAVIVNNDAAGSVTINGGTFILNNSTNDWQGIVSPGGDLVINGGVFNSTHIGDKGKSGSILDHLGAGCSAEQIAFSEPYASWVSQVYLVSSAASSGITYAANATIEENVETTDVLINSGVTVTLTKGFKLTCDNLAFEDATAKLVIEAGATVIVEDEIRSSSVDNIHMTMDGQDNGDGNSYLLIKAGQIQESHPLATVVLKSKAYQKANGAYVFQRFTVPTYPGSDTEIARKDIGYTVPTAMYGWDYANDTWKYMESESVFEPFQCYDMTTQAAAANAQYVFKCRLVGNGNAELPLQGHWNYYANSYTAPIDIAPVIRYLYDDYQGDISSSVYVHHANGDYWDPINVAQVIRNRMLQTTIEPMQAFVLERINSSANNPSIDYTTHIYNPFMGISNSAPKRNAPVQLDFAYATMRIEAADGSRNTMEMYEGNQFDASFDNGYDVAKHMNENCFNMYFVAQEGNMAYLASDNVANTAITLDTKEATSYTVNFEDVTMEGYALRDNLTGTETELVSGNTYSFSAPVNSKIEGRFEIVAIAKMPTAIENTEVKADKKGIYTLTGQYLGENFHALPAGVYVINGKKVVK